MENSDYTKILTEEIAFAKKHIQENKNRPSELPFFPCEVYDENEQTKLVTIDALDGLFFFETFASYGLYLDGDCWEGVVEQLLEKEKPHLLEQIEFDSEENTFVALFNTKESQLEFAGFIHDICSNETRLKSYLEKIDKEQIDS